VKHFDDKLVNSRQSMPALRQKQLFLHLSIFFLDSEVSNPGRYQNLPAAMPRVGSFHLPIEKMLGVWKSTPGTKRRSVKLATVQN
jgi:hypothetical protein